MYKISNNNINTFNEYTNISRPQLRAKKTNKNPLFIYIINIYEQHIKLLHNFIIIKIYELKIITAKNTCIKHLYITNIYSNNRILQIKKCSKKLISKA